MHPVETVEFDSGPSSPGFTCSCLINLDCWVEWNPCSFWNTFYIFFLNICIQQWFAKSFKQMRWSSRKKCLHRHHRASPISGSVCVMSFGNVKRLCAGGMASIEGNTKPWDGWLSSSLLYYHRPKSFFFFGLRRCLTHSLFLPSPSVSLVLVLPLGLSLSVSSKSSPTPVCVQMALWSFSLRDLALLTHQQLCHTKHTAP